MSLITCAVSDLVHREYSYRLGTVVLTEDTSNKKRLKNTKNTYLIIFGPDQNDQMEWFLKQPQWTIVYRGIKARNKNYTECSKGRNTLFIFEYNEPKA